MLIEGQWRTAPISLHALPGSWLRFLEVRPGTEYDSSFKEVDRNYAIQQCKSIMSDPPSATLEELNFALAYILDPELSDDKNFVYPATTFFAVLDRLLPEAETEWQATKAIDPLRQSGINFCLFAISRVYGSRGEVDHRNRIVPYVERIAKMGTPALDLFHRNAMYELMVTYKPHGMTYSPGKDWGYVVPPGQPYVCLATMRQQSGASSTWVQPVQEAGLYTAYQRDGLLQQVSSHFAKNPALWPIWEFWLMEFASILVNAKRHRESYIVDHLVKCFTQLTPLDGKYSPFLRDMIECAHLQPEAIDVVVKKLTMRLNEAPGDIAQRRNPLDALIWAAGAFNNLKLMKLLKDQFSAEQEPVWKKAMTLSTFTTDSQTKAFGSQYDEKEYPLYHAVSGKAPEVVEFMVATGAPVDAMSEQNTLALAAAIELQHLPTIKALLKSGATLTKGWKTNDVWTNGLELSAQMASFEVFEFFFNETKVSANTAINKNSLISTVARYGRVQHATFLLNKGARVESPNADKFRPISLAVMTAHLEMVKLLVSRGASVNAADEESLCTPLHYAVMNAQPDIVRFLIKSGANPDQAAGLNGGTTALSLAAELGHYTTMKALLESGAKVNARRPSDGKTALHNACREGVNVKSAIVLLENGADVNVVDSEGNTPIHCAAAWNHQALEVIVQKATNVSPLNKAGHSPLDYSPCVHVAIGHLKDKLRKATSYEPSLLKFHDAQSKEYAVNQAKIRKEAGEEEDDDDGWAYADTLNSVICWTDVLDLLQAGQHLKIVKFGRSFFRSRGEHAAPAGSSEAKEREYINNDPKQKAVLNFLKTNYALQVFELPPKLINPAVISEIDGYMRRNRRLQNPGGRVQMSIGTLATDNVTTDISVTVAGHVISLHSCVVKVRWPSFADPAHQEALAALAGIPATTVRHLKRFIYCDDLPGTSAALFFEDNTKLTMKEVLTVLSQLMTIALVSNYRRLYERIEILLLELGVHQGKIDKEMVALVAQHKSLAIENYQARLTAALSKPLTPYVPGSDLVKDLTYLYKTCSHGGDFELVVANGSGQATLKCNKAVLSARWPYIQAKCKGKANTRLDLSNMNEGTGMDLAIAKALLLYFYSGALGDMKTLINQHHQRFTKYIAVFGFHQNEDARLIHSELIDLIVKTTGSPAPSPTPMPDPAPSKASAANSTPAAAPKNEAPAAAPPKAAAPKKGANKAKQQAAPQAEPQPAPAAAAPNAATPKPVSRIVVEEYDEEEDRLQTAKLQAEKDAAAAKAATTKAAAERQAREEQSAKDKAAAKTAAAKQAREEQSARDKAAAAKQKTEAEAEARRKEAEAREAAELAANSGPKIPPPADGFTLRTEDEVD